MNISRKEFFRKSLLSIGEAVFTVSDALKAPAVTITTEIQNSDVFEAHPREDRIALARNEYCLARSCGCFLCTERCLAGAIMLIPGVGIKIDGELCTGCGTCEYVCPVEPKAITLIMRHT